MARKGTIAKSVEEKADALTANKSTIAKSVGEKGFALMETTNLDA